MSLSVLKNDNNETNPNLPNQATEQSKTSQRTPPDSSPTVPFPPLPPMPPTEAPTFVSSRGPPLPIEDSSDGLDLLANLPPPPPPESVPTEKTEQLNTSTSQVEDMDLSDGDDDCDGGEVETNLEHLKNEGHVNSQDTAIASTEITASQIMGGNIVYNNHPHMYQNYYQAYSEMFPGQLPAGVTKDVKQAGVNPLNDALSSFYSDLASIDNTSERDYDAGPKDLHPSVVEPSTDAGLPSTTNNQMSVQLTDLDSSVPHHLLNPCAGGSSTLDDRSNSPRSLTPDRGFLEEKDKRKKKAKLASGLSMKKKGVSNLVAKWQNIQEESSKHRPQ